MKAQTFNMGDVVLCDLCGKDYSNSSAIGGLTFGSKACCPDCAPRIEERAKKHGETSYIGGRCPKDKTFAAWVREDLRNGAPATTTIYSFD